MFGISKKGSLRFMSNRFSYRLLSTSLMAIALVVSSAAQAQTFAPSIAPAPGALPSAKSGFADLSTGLLVLNQTDLVVRDVIPISLTRTYRQADTVSRPFGIGTSD